MTGAEIRKLGSLIYNGKLPPFELLRPLRLDDFDALRRFTHSSEPDTDQLRAFSLRAEVDEGELR